MTVRTKAALLFELSSGGSSGKVVENTLVRDIIDSMADDAATDTRLDALELGLNTARILWTLTDADMNVDTDQAFTKVGTFTNYLVTDIRVTGASTSLTTAAGGVYDTAAKGGTALVAAGQTYAALTGATLGLDLTLAAYAKGLRSGASLFLSLTTPQGGAATADFVVIGVPLS